jgi:hypothetical protein
VLEHGLRHLAWLARDDAAVQSLLSEVWKRALADYVPEPPATWGEVTLGSLGHALAASLRRAPSPLVPIRPLHNKVFHWLQPTVPSISDWL